MFSCRAMGIYVKRKLHERVALPTALYESETWSMAVVKKKILHIMKMRCLKSMYGVMSIE